MNKISYWKRNRQKILPWVKDWSGDQNRVRHEKNVSKLEFTDWFFCHPTAFKLVYFGTDLVSFFLFLPLMIYCVNKGFVFPALICGGIIIFSVYSFRKKFMNRKAFEDVTYYDLWMRD